MINDTDDKFGLGKAISRSKLNMPDADFEQQVMAQVYQEVNRKKSGLYMRYAMLFFILFVVAGCLASSNFIQLPQVGVIAQPTLKLVFEAGFVLCTLLQVDQFFQYFKHKNTF